MKIGITAIKGKVSKLLAYEIYNNNLFDITSALVREGYDEVGSDIGKFLGLKETNTYITDNITKFVDDSDIIVDFSSTDLTLKLAKIVSEKQKILISGTRNLTDDEIDILKQYANNCTIIYSNNMSIGINLFMNLLKKTSAILGENYDINIVEFKNKFKEFEDISNTTTSIAKAIAEGRGWDEVYKKTDKTDNKLNNKQINFATLRGGDKISEYSILFNSTGEEIEFKHTVNNNLAFIKGTIRAIIWSVGKNNGFYTMQDVLKI